MFLTVTTLWESMSKRPHLKEAKDWKVAVTSIVLQNLPLASFRDLAWKWGKRGGLGWHPCASPSDMPPTLNLEFETSCVVLAQITKASPATSLPLLGSICWYSLRKYGGLFLCFISIERFTASLRMDFSLFLVMVEGHVGIAHSRQSKTGLCVICLYFWIYYWFEYSLTKQYQMMTFPELSLTADPWRWAKKGEVLVGK